ncbi:G-protein coupled receptor 54-like [Convolutriloba macropyga]|uniref:G-protein coupled receptor 54-like n=1 Tax=Convolutriloba macropyga TaxID=536237 RepID=UPI003F5286A8
MALLATDRYLVFRHPMAALQYRQPKVALISNVAVWIFSFIACCPIVYATWPGPSELNSPYCEERWSKTAILLFYLYFFCFSYVCPVVTALVCYGKIFQLIQNSDEQTQQACNENLGNREVLLKRRKRVTLMVTIISVCFIVIWTPIHTVNLVIRVRDMDENNHFTRAQLIIALLCRALMYVGSTINPVIYGFVGQNFRNNLMQTINRVRKPRDPNLTGTKNSRVAFLAEGKVGTYNANGVNTLRIVNSSNSRRFENVKRNNSSATMTTSYNVKSTSSEKRSPIGRSAETSGMYSIRIIADIAVK